VIVCFVDIGEFIDLIYCVQRHFQLYHGD